MYYKSSVKTTRMCKKAYRRAERKLGVNMKKLQCVANLVTIHKNHYQNINWLKSQGPTFSQERFCIFLSKKYAYFSNKNIKFLRIKISQKISHIATAKIISHKRMQLATFG